MASEGIEEFEIPKGYKNFTNGLNIKLKKGLNVITGLNGVGKSKLLEYIYYENNNKGCLTLFRTNVGNDDLNRINFVSRRFIYGGSRYSNINVISVDDILNEIEGEYVNFIRRNNKQISQIFSYKDAVYNFMFDENSVLNNNGKNRISFIKEAVIKTLEKYTNVDSENIKKQFGIIDKDALRWNVKQELKENNQIQCRQRNQDKIADEYIGNKQNEDKIFKIEYDYFIKNNKIRSKVELIDYISDSLYLLKDMNSIVDKISNIIYNDAVEHPRKQQVWEKINNILKKGKYNEVFRYLLEQPDTRINYTNYTITFKHKNIDSKRRITLDNLSSGEKVIFELICYIYCIDYSNSSKKIKDKTKWILLDEFDAVLNPILSKVFIDTIRKELVERDINVVLTTHSPITISMVEPNELLWIELDENNCHNIKYIDSDTEKKNLLKKIAPNFLYEDEFGSLILNTINTISYGKFIILVEGKTDKQHFEIARDFLNLKDKYVFIDCDGADNIVTVINAIIKLIDTIKNEITIKPEKILSIFDCDTKGRECLIKLINNSNGDNNSIKSIKILENNKKTRNPVFKLKHNIRTLLLTPSKDNNSFWENEDYENISYAIEHLYNIEKFNNNGKQTLLMKSNKENGYNFAEYPYFFQPIKEDSRKEKFYNYVDKHREEFENIFDIEFRRIFNIIDNIEDDINSKL